MEKLVNTPFDKIANYVPTEEDVRLSELINRYLHYKKEKELRIRAFFEDVVRKSKVDKNLKDKMLYILSFATIEAYTSESSCTMIIKSTERNLDIDIPLQLKKNTMSPKISITKSAEGLESAIAGLIISSIDFNEFENICNFLALFKDTKQYNLDIDLLGFNLTMNSNEIDIKEIKNDYAPNIITVTAKGNINFIRQAKRGGNEEYINTFLSHLFFFLNNSYVKRSEIPPQLMSYEYTNEEELKNIIDKNEESNPSINNQSFRTSEEKYYIEINNEIKELNGVIEITEEDEDNYLCKFFDESTLKVSKTKIFKIVKYQRTQSRAENILGIRH